MALAINDAGDVLTDASGKWMPASRAVNDTTGETLVHDGDAWKPVAALKAAPATDTAPAPDQAAPAATPSLTAYAGTVDTDAPASVSLPSPTDMRDKLQQADMSALTALQPDPHAGIAERVGHRVAQLGVHTLAGIASMPLNAMIGVGQGPGGAVTINPETNTLGLTPEASAAAGFAASPLRFGGAAVVPPTITAREVQARDGVSIMEAWRRAHAENRAPAASIADIGAAPDIDTAIAAAGKAAEGSADDIPTVTVTANAPGTAEALGASPEAAGVSGATPIPQSAGAAATPQFGGAAASRQGTPLNAFGRSAREIKGQQADMELADLMQTPQKGDARDIIPGATQTKAEIEQLPSVSRQAKGLRQEFREGFDDHEKANNELYHNWVDDVVPPREQVGTMKDTREANWKADEKVAFGPKPNGELVDTAPIVQHMMDVLADPIEKSNSYLKKAFQPFLDALTDDNGAPKNMGTKELYGLRQEMGRKVKDMATDTDLAHVRSQFGDMMDVTDDTITSGAAAYREMMDRYREASGPITAAERLQDIKLKITNGSDRIITFGAFDRFMKSLWLERNGPNPYAPAKSIPQETWDHLMMLHQRLARSASDQELARTRGSDTTQLIMEMMRKGAIGSAHAIVGAMTHGLGNVAIPFVTRQIDQGLAARQVGRHLNPDLAQYPTPGP